MKAALIIACLLVGCGDVSSSTSSGAGGSGGYGAKAGGGSAGMAGASELAGGHAGAAAGAGGAGDDTSSVGGQGTPVGTGGSGGSGGTGGAGGSPDCACPDGQFCWHGICACTPSNAGTGNVSGGVCGGCRFTAHYCPGACVPVGVSPDCN